MEVKHTFTSVLRECARIANDRCKEAKTLRQLMEGGSNPSTILKFEQQKRHQEQMEDIRRTQEKYLNVLLSREDAILAKQLLLNNTKSQGDKVRREKQELYKQLEKLKQDQNEEIAKIIEKYHALERTTREAYNSMINEKRKRAVEVVEESRQLKLILAKQKEEDERKKIQLIREIKAVQAMRLKPIKNYNPMESSGLGLLCEMSLTELRENLLSTKMRLTKEVENRNTIIRQERERKKNLMKSNQRLLERYKARRGMHSSNLTSENHIDIINFPTIESLRKLLKERKAQRRGQKMK